MVTALKWFMFVACLCALLVIATFYATHSGEITSLSRSGLRTFGVLCVAIYGCFVLGASLLKRRRPSEGNPISVPQPSREGKNTTARGPDENYIRVAFRKRPGVVLLLIGFMFSLPLLLSFVSPIAHDLTGTQYWQSVIVGELLIGGCFVVVWIRAKRDP